MLDDAVNLALSAGALLKKGFNTSHTIWNKEGVQNLVTECDLASEKLILSALKKKYPSHSFLAEESGGSQESEEVLWIIDPLDGTVNFARHIPAFCVSIAAYKKGAPLLGVVYQPMTDELFIAEKGKGATLNGKKISVSKASSLEETLIATGFPYNVQEDPLKCISLLSSFLKKGCPIRRIGSAALDMAYTAAGRFDAYYETGIKPWDVAAGALLIEESGGKVTDWQGAPYSLFASEGILATNDPVHSIMLEAIANGRSV